MSETKSRRGTPRGSEITSEAARARWSRAPAAQAAIDKIVAQAPRLTEEQRAQLRAVLAPIKSILEEPTKMIKELVYSRPPRRTSVQENDFPYGYPARICYIELLDGKLNQLAARDESREACRRAMAGESQIFAVWPGDYRSDLFVVDDLEAWSQAIRA